MEAQTAQELKAAQSITLGRYRLYHYPDGTFWVGFATSRVEVPLIGVSAPLSPIELRTVRERHALFVRNCSAHGSEAILWDERVIDDVPVRWEILLREGDDGDLHLQAHFLTYGPLLAEVHFLYNYIAENIYQRTFYRPHASALIVTPHHALSIITQHPADPACLRLQQDELLTWILPIAGLHQQSLHLCIRLVKLVESGEAVLRHIEHRALLFPPRPQQFPSLKLRAAARSAVALLLSPERQAHFAEDQIVLRIAPGEARYSVFTLAAAKALLDWRRLCGEEAAAWTARLALNSAMEFQIVNAQHTNSGACWDVLDANKHGSNILGQRKLNLYRNARVVQHLLMLHRDTGSELCVRVALNGLSWLLLKRGATGIYDGADVLPDGTVQGGCGKGIMGAIISVMCAAYGLTETEAYIHAANRLAEYLLRDACEPMSPGTVLPIGNLPNLRDDVFAASSAIEGLARLYWTYPHESMREGALRMMEWLRLWQIEEYMDGCGAEGEVLAGDGSSHGFVDASVEAARGALWAFGLNRDARWLGFATRALQAAADHLDPIAGFAKAKLAYPDQVHTLAMFVRTYLHWLLSLPALVPEVESDLDLLVCRAGNRIFVLEPSLWQSIRVQAKGLVDWVALVCPATHDILLAVLTDGSSGAVQVDTADRRQLVTDLKGGSSGALYPLHAVPGLGSIGVYLLQA